MTDSVFIPPGATGCPDMLTAAECEELASLEAQAPPSVQDALWPLAVLVLGVVAFVLRPGAD